MQAAPNRFRPPLDVAIGSLHITEAARELVTDADALRAISSHKRGDWGEASDWARNDLELERCNRVTGIHRTEAGQVFWVVTDLTRRTTMLALPSDYE